MIPLSNTLCHLIFLLMNKPKVRAISLYFTVKKSVHRKMETEMTGYSAFIPGYGSPFN